MSVYIELIAGSYRFKIEYFTFEYSSLYKAINKIKSCGFKPVFIPVI